MEECGWSGMSISHMLQHGLASHLTSDIPPPLLNDGGALTHMHRTRQSTHLLHTFGQAPGDEADEQGAQRRRAHSAAPSPSAAAVQRLTDLPDPGLHLRGGGDDLQQLPGSCRQSSGVGDVHLDAGILLRT